MNEIVKTKLTQIFLTLITVFVICSTITIAQTRKNKDWIGIYTFTDKAQPSQRRNVYDVVPIIEYIITVKKNRSNRLSATFEANGMQTFEVYQCSVEENNGRLNFYFQSGGIPEGGTDNPKNFKKNALLFGLTEAKVGAKTKYQFHSADYKIERLLPKMKSQSINFDKKK